MKTCRLVCGDALEVLRGLDAGSVDAVITDPPYPCIQRDYGYWTEAEWFAMVNPVVAECRRVLKPTGSAVFILQPNSETAGKLRAWPWRFMADWCERWGQVQDAYWWNTQALPATMSFPGLMRSSVKPAVWLGPPDCWRDLSAVMWGESDINKAKRESGRCTAKLKARPSGKTHSDRRMVEAAAANGGVTPFNCLPIGNGGDGDSAGNHGHGAGTPAALCSWWTRYICPPSGVCLDPFCGSGTGPAEALRLGRSAIGIDRQADYVRMAERRCRAAAAEMSLYEPWEVTVEGME